MRRNLVFIVVTLSNVNGILTSFHRHKKPSRRCRRRPGCVTMVLPSPKLAIAAYRSALTAAPLITNCVTSSGLSVVSGAIAQKIERRDCPVPNNPQHSISRSFWMSIWGFGFSGLILSHWFVILNSYFPADGLTLVGAVKKVFVNQLVLSTCLNTLFFIFTTYTRADLSTTGQNRVIILRQKLQNDLFPTIKRSFAFWGIIQTVNFLYVPTEYALIYTNVGALIWTVYLSLVGFRKLKPQ